MSELSIKTIDQIPLSTLKECADRLIGKDYYAIEQLEEIFRDDLSHKSSCGLVDQTGKLLGFRISQGPGSWASSFKEGKITPTKWPFPKDKAAYFKSLFLDPSVQRLGWGQKLSLKSMEILKANGSAGVVSHSWKESPSSFKYLEKIGFTPLREHPLFWSKIDYECTLCGKPPCQCTSIEMIKVL